MFDLKKTSLPGSGGVIRHAREMNCMTQADWGAELAGRVGRDTPYPQSRVATWEGGSKSPRLNVRSACRDDAALWAIGEIERILGVEISEDQCEKIVAAIVECQS